VATTNTRPPLEIAVGETTVWAFENSEFSPGDGWAVSYFFRGAGSVDLVGVVNGSAFDFAVVAATFSLAGGYDWEAIATHAGNSERCRVAAGLLRVVANIEVSGATASVTTFNERMLSALEAALENTATQGQRSYTIAGRSLERMTLEELLKNRDIFARRVKSEAALAAVGLTSAPRRVGVRLR